MLMCLGRKMGELVVSSAYMSLVYEAIFTLISIRDVFYQTVNMRRFVSKSTRFLRCVIFIIEFTIKGGGQNAYLSLG